MKLEIGIPEKERASVVKVLTQLLADEYVLYSKTRNYHWNVTGPHFHEYHKLFEAQYEELSNMVDDLAERIRALGDQSIGTLAEFTQYTRLKEHPGEYPLARDMIAGLVSDHETVIRQLRADVDLCVDKYHDTGTSDFLTGLMEQHEKMAWMLRVMLEGRNG